MPVLSYTMYEFLNGSNWQFVDGLNLTIDFFDRLGYFFGYPFHHPYEILVLKVLDQHNGKLETTFRQEYVEIHVEYMIYQVLHFKKNITSATQDFQPF